MKILGSRTHREKAHPWLQYEISCDKTFKQDKCSFTNIPRVRSEVVWEERVLTSSYIYNVQLAPEDS